MKKGKRGKKALSGVIVAVLIVLLVISAIVFVYSFVIPMIQRSAKQAEENSFTNNIELDRSSIVLNDSLSLLEFRVNKIGQNQLSSIKALVLVNGTSLSYNLFDVPKNLESSSYILNITKPGKIEEIFVYPVLSNGKIGFGQRENIYGVKTGEVSESLDVINPEKELNNNCVSNWECGDWSKCAVLYNLNNLISDEIVLKGEKNRLCEDKNKCNSNINERKECDDKATISVKKVIDNSTGKEFVEVYDTNNILMSRLEYIQGGVNQLNIEIPIE